ncbi:sarcosine oxidase alpha subunit [Gluconacetobacter sp. SXCC-1]|uniref:(2Fe-2S)-binding protein n=1 Tax=Komagataeibacter rhaeticus TaxID=215221 RepID=A0A181CEE4_9PROT|nr:(2Fe-2S)-binding protein [Komagataeibacter rhaeticus]ATU72730.1 (2Fe-2S)-binding protein [Komagataeibacter xylinus]EGG76587.1 sarcosine oxidase alpha subunit [Gluconacetobacter sp. SXCC-1]QIP36558.1 (2Fe-2S)-binding protein [Komagataeibacter rhaeticus]QOC46330.1 (2Fe-2S)-binding protein [Komagataeibacter rhaeticus]WPP22501.1 (2Fe-2S)-binding protein [Komagataeibacter rhaeticus]
MTDRSRFRRIVAPAGPRITFTLDGRVLEARLGDSVAVAMMLAGYPACGSLPPTGRVRVPYCLMGACHECLVRVDGRSMHQACLLPVRTGMCIETDLNGHGS